MQGDDCSGRDRQYLTMTQQWYCYPERKEYVQLYSTSQPRAASRFRCQCLRTYTESLSEFGGRRNRSVTLELLTIPYRLQLKHRRQHNKSPTDSNSSPSSVDLTGPRSVRTRLTWAILGTHQKNLGYIGPCKENEEGRRSQMSCWAGSLGPLP